MTGVPKTRGPPVPSPRPARSHHLPFSCSAPAVFNLTRRGAAFWYFPCRPLAADDVQSIHGYWRESDQEKCVHAGKCSSLGTNLVNVGRRSHTPTTPHTRHSSASNNTCGDEGGGRKRAAELDSRPATDDDSRSNRLCIFGAQVRRSSDPFSPLSLLSLRTDLRTLLWSASAHGYKKNCVRPPSTTMTG